MHSAQVTSYGQCVDQFVTEQTAAVTQLHTKMEIMASSQVRVKDNTYHSMWYDYSIDM